MIRDLFFTLLLLLLVGPLSAQHRDTVYVERETVTYDTVTVYDTVRVHDTLNIADYLRSEEFERLFYSSEYVDNLSLTDSMKEKLLRQTVTFWERSVFKDEQQTFSSMDSIKKYGLAGLIILGLNAMSPAQTDSTAAGTSHNPKQHKTHLFNNSINGFHLGYTLQANLVEPVLWEEIPSGKKLHDNIRFGFHAGLECSYHFADYFGVSGALNFGTTASGFFRFSVPLKFEFHYPVSDRILVTANTGVRLRVPVQTFLTGFDKYYGYRGHILNTSSILERNIPFADILLDAGIWYRLPKDNYLRFTAGLSFATAAEIAGFEVDYYGEPVATFSHRNNHLYFQIAYIQSFNKHRKIIQAQPHWSTYDGMHHRHEVRFEVSDPFGVFFLMNLHTIDYQNYTEYVFDPGDGLAFAFRNTPVFSFNYHYRLTKWLWVGAMVNYAYYKDHTDLPFHTNAVYTQRTINCLTMMPELRFSYLNRPHVTLYSAVAAGTSLFFGKQLYAERNGDFSWEKISKVYPSCQLTAFGVRAGGEHLFGSFELGVGMKGFVSGGIGYAF